MAQVQLSHLGKRYAGGTQAAVHDVNLTIEHGELFVLLGPSGCGKSTTLRMIAGLEVISDGDLIIDGQRVNGLPSKDRDIAMVFQSYALYPHMSVRDNLAFGLRRRAFKASEITRRVALASQILGLDSYLERKPHALSGGQRQRVALGRAIVRDPKVFLFDEPLSNLDAKLRVAMRAEIKSLHQRLKTTTVYVTHDQIEAMTMADRIVVMHDGIVEQIGTPLELFDHPGNLFVAQFIGSPAMNVFEGTLRSQQGRLWVEADGQQWPVGSVAGGKDGQSVHYGIRPGDITMVEPAQGISAAVVVVEPTGAETEIILQVGETMLTLVLHGRTDVKPDQVIGLQIAAEKVHLFEKSGGQRIG